MAGTAQDVIRVIQEQDIKMVDINGQYRHVTIPAENFSEETMKSGMGLDASNYGCAVVEESDLVFIPDPDTALVDPFCSIPALPEEEKAKLKGLPTSLDEALNALEADHDYLTAGDVFPEELIANFIRNLRRECRQMAAIPHPAEFDRYDDL